MTFARAVGPRRGTGTRLVEGLALARAWGFESPFRTSNKKARFPGPFSLSVAKKTNGWLTGSVS